MLEIIDINVFEIMTLPNNLVLICRFLDHNLMFSSGFKLTNEKGITVLQCERNEA